MKKVTDPPKKKQKNKRKVSIWKKKKKKEKKIEKKNDEDLIVKKPKSSRDISKESDDEDLINDPILNLPLDVIFMIMSYLTQKYLKLSLVSKSWKMMMMSLVTDVHIRSLNDIKSIVACCPSIKNIKFSLEGKIDDNNWDYLMPLSQLTYIQSLDFSGCQLQKMTNRNDLTMLVSKLGLNLFPNLRGLDFSFCKYQGKEISKLYSKDLQLFSDLVGMNYLNLTFNNINDLFHLSKLTALDTLILFQCYKLASLFQIQEFSMLSTLNLNSCYEITTKELIYLSTLTNLTDLNIKNCRKIGPDIFPVNLLTNIQKT